MREQSSRSAYLPDPFVGLLPRRLDELDHRPLDPPGVLVRLQPDPPRVVQRVGHFPVDVELKLGARGIADADRRRMLVAREPRELPLR